jgi:predicted dehydrogenase
MDPLGVGIIGTGWVAKEHAAAFTRNPLTRVVALYSRRHDDAEAKRHAWELDDAIVYDNYATLLADRRVQIVSICTPNHLHAEQTIQAAQAGKHLLIEKPPALKLRDLRAMQDAVHSARVRTVVGFVLRWNPLIQTMKSLLEQGALGRVFFAQVDYWNNSGRGDIPGHWVTQRATGGSAFLTGGNHAVDTLRWLVGDEVIEVSALGTQVNHNYDYFPTMLALVRFAGGAIGRLSAILEGRLPYQFNIDLLGDRGSIRDQHLWSPDLFPGQRDWINIPTIAPTSGDVAHHPFQGEIDHLVECIHQDRESFVNLDDAVKTIELCLAIDQSAVEGRTVRLPLEQQLSM